MVSDQRCGILWHYYKLVGGAGGVEACVSRIWTVNLTYNHAFSKSLLLFVVIYVLRLVDGDGGKPQSGATMKDDVEGDEGGSAVSHCTAHLGCE